MPKPPTDQFPILRAHARKPERFDLAVQVLSQGLAEGSIRKKDHDEAKQILGDAVYRSWNATIGEPFFHAGRWETQPAEVRKLMEGTTPGNLHEVLHFAKKLAIVPSQAPALQAMRALVAEALPLAQAAAELKPMIVKGREPNPEPAAPANPDQVRATCSCCFRGIAVTAAGKMAHHGYQRPFEGYQTRSCDGTRFPPLEVSTEGLEWLIWHMEEHRDQVQDRLDRKESLTKLTYSLREKGQVVRKEVEKGHPDWDRRFRSWEAAAQEELRQTHATLDQLGKTLEEWRARTPPRPDQMEEEGPEP